MKFRELLDEDRRLAVLQFLAEADDGSLNEGLLERMLLRMRFGIVGRDTLRGYLTWLEGAGMLRLEKMPLENGADLWLATLTKLGQEVSAGRRWPGIAHPTQA